LGAASLLLAGLRTGGNLAGLPRLGGVMSERAWFVAIGGKQEGPYAETEFRQHIAQGSVTPDMLVWSDGMSDWQKAGDVPGLMSARSRPPASPPSGPPIARAPISGQASGGGAISVDFGIWELLGRSIVFVIGYLLVIPAPWVATSFYGWMTSRLRVPQRPNLTFTGQPMDIWYVFMGMAALTYVGVTGIPFIKYIVPFAQAYLSWMTLRWIAVNLSSNGRQLPISFNGSPLVYVGWYVLMYISAFTIIGWAWVITAWMRWMCRNVEGTRREIVFNGTGLEMLWRSLVFGIACVFLIPIPWVLKWYTNWYVSQFALVERA
jgi:hypothetical protein